MEIGIPVERHPSEYRVGLTPQWVRQLIQEGHQCYVERGAGRGAGFQDRDYELAGARVVYDVQEVYKRADMVLKTVGPGVDELDLLREGQTICAFWHLAARPREITRAVIEKRITAVAYEMIQLEDGFLPVLHPLSQIAGRMVPQVAARFLQNDGGGSGVLISGVPGTPSSDVVILGGGTVGINAARTFLGLGAQVIVLDESLERLRHIDVLFNGQVQTMVAHDYNVARVVQFANVLVGAVLVPGERAPIIVTREMVRTMRPDSLIMDVSIDQGGCVETSRPTTHENPVFVVENVMHYCVPNMPGVVARTATHAYLNAAWPYIQMLAARGTQVAMGADLALRHGIMIHEGRIYNQSLATLVEGV